MKDVLVKTTARDIDIISSMSEHLMSDSEVTVSDDSM